MGNTTMYYSFKDELANMNDEDIIGIIKTGNTEAQNYLIDK